MLDGSASYKSGGPEPTLTAVMVLRAPRCRAVTYTLLIFADEFDRAPIQSVVANPGGRTNRVGFGPLAVDDPDGTVCLVVTTTVGPRLFDRAPSTGCVVVALDDEGRPRGQQFV